MNAPSLRSPNQVVAAEFVAGAPAVASLPAAELPEIAFAGRSNVGKSSLLNAMMQRKSLARTSGTPGCTRQINVFHVKAADGLDLHFVDLPGYGYAKVSKKEKADWGPMLEGYLQSRPTLRALVLLVDVRRGLEADDHQLLDFGRSVRDLPGRSRALQLILVATKTDKISLSKRKPAMVEFAKSTGDLRAVAFSAETGDGREELWSRLRAAI